MVLSLEIWGALSKEKSGQTLKVQPLDFAAPVNPCPAT
jgi:hypothetical protein